MTPLQTLFLFLGLFGWICVIAKWRDWPPFRITKRPAVRVSAEWLADNRAEIIHNAIKQGPTRIVKADFQRRGTGR